MTGHGLQTELRLSTLVVGRLLIVDPRGRLLIVDPRSRLLKTCPCCSYTLM